MLMNFYILTKITDWLIMAKITLKKLSHSYLTKQNNDSDWALRGVDIDWKDGGAYALLGSLWMWKNYIIKYYFWIT
jgi:hypothetical protein